MMSGVATTRARATRRESHDRRVASHLPCGPLSLRAAAIPTGAARVVVCHPQSTAAPWTTGSSHRRAAPRCRGRRDARSTPRRRPERGDTGRTAEVDDARAALDALASARRPRLASPATLRRGGRGAAPRSATRAGASAIALPTAMLDADFDGCRTPTLSSRATRPVLPARGARRAACALSGPDGGGAHPRRRPLPSPRTARGRAHRPLPDCGLRVSARGSGARRRARRADAGSEPPAGAVPGRGPRTSRGARPAAARRASREQVNVRAARAELHLRCLRRAPRAGGAAARRPAAVVGAPRRRPPTPGISSVRPFAGGLPYRSPAHDDGRPSPPALTTARSTRRIPAAGAHRRLGTRTPRRRSTPRVIGVASATCVSRRRAPSTTLAPAPAAARSVGRRHRAEADRRAGLDTAAPHGVRSTRAACRRRTGTTRCPRRRRSEHRRAGGVAAAEVDVGRALPATTRLPRWQSDSVDQPCRGQVPSARRRAPSAPSAGRR
jgi:hypothetical protein